VAQYRLNPTRSVAEFPEPHSLSHWWHHHDNDVALALHGADWQAASGWQRRVLPARPQAVLPSEVKCSTRPGIGSTQVAVRTGCGCRLAACPNSTGLASPCPFAERVVMRTPAVAASALPEFSLFSGGHAASGPRQRPGGVTPLAARGQPNTGSPPAPQCRVSCAIPTSISGNIGLAT
jgi:hypothetical protein